MSLAQTIESDLKTALLGKKQAEVDLLRLLKAALQNEMIQLKKQELSDEETLRIINKEKKKRQDAIQLYTKGNRKELADKEKQEIELIQKYLPAPLNQEEVEKITQKVIDEMGEVGPSQFGQVIKSVMAKTKGQADGKLVSTIVKEKLNS